MESVYANFSLPKFKTEYLHENLIDILKEMGVKAAFDGQKADFLNMYSAKPQDNVFYRPDTAKDLYFRG